MVVIVLHDAAGIVGKVKPACVIDGGCARKDNPSHWAGVRRRELPAAF